MNSPVTVSVKGRCIISDDLGNVHLDKTNSIHSINLSRAFARGLSNESNSFISKFAFGNGGTYFGVNGTHIAKPTNNGINDKNRYRSRLYNETYAEYIDESSNKISSGEGSSPENDPISVLNSKSGPGVVSTEIYQDGYKDYSQVVVTCVLNKMEPTSQYLTDLLSDTEDNANTVFEFDEIGLFTAGIESDVPTSGFQTVTFNTPNLYVKTGLEIGKLYTFVATVNDEEKQYSYIPTATNDGTITFKDLVLQLNKILPDIKVTMDNGGSTTGNYFGYMKFTSKKTGLSSFVKIKQEFNRENWLFGSIPLFVKLNDVVYGTNIGYQNSPNEPSQEYSRMLTHLIFDPIRKPANRTYIFEYTLDIKVDENKVEENVVSTN